MFKALMVYSLMGIVFLFVLFYCILTAVKNTSDNYFRGSDTTITIHNGKPDTLIIKRHNPFK